MDIDPRIYTVSIFLVAVCAMHHWFYENDYIKVAPKGMFINVYFVASFFALYMAYLMAKQQRLLDF
jgi:exosortase/archaeosortase